MILIKNVQIINEGSTKPGSLLIKGKFIEKIFNDTNPETPQGTKKIIEGNAMLLMPGVIDMHVHFREPGLTHKGDTASESKAALAGGVTSFADMPNTLPKTTGQKELEAKQQIAAKNSFINYSYYVGAFDGNEKFIENCNPKYVPGVKVFMGASTGSMQIQGNALNAVFKQKNLRITAHCEDDALIDENTKAFQKKYGDAIPFKYHAEIRSDDACMKSSEEAVALVKQYRSKLHIAHISTKKELALLENKSDVSKKTITSELCIHHLWFSKKDYDKLGAHIKWNPSIKTEEDRQALIKALKDNLIDIIVTDHAPHTAQEKAQPYMQAPSGAPMIQHSLQAAFELADQGCFSKEFVTEKMCHQPARLFNISKRGFVKEGYYADLVLVNTDANYKVSESNILYKCGWSPMIGTEFGNCPEYVFVNGNLLYEKGTFGEAGQGMPLVFEVG